ncbi:YrhC family protein [Bacillota bacterium Lsc_1132]
MKNQAKQLYEKMVDYKRFAVTVLAAGVFFYLGVIIPADTKTTIDLNIMTLSSIAFLAVSIGLFIRSKQYRQKLMELEEGQEYLVKK